MGGQHPRPPGLAAPRSGPAVERDVPPARHDDGDEDAARHHRRPRPRRRARRAPEPRRDGTDRRRSSTASSSASRRPQDTAKRLGKTFRTRLRDDAARRGDRRGRRVHVRAAVAAKTVRRSRSSWASCRRPGAPRSSHRREGRRRRVHGPAVADALRTLGYLPFVPPNVGGLPEGPAPARTAQPRAHVRPVRPCRRRRPSRALDDLLDRFGLLDVSDRTRDGRREAITPADVGLCSSARRPSTRST